MAWALALFALVVWVYGALAWHVSRLVPVVRTDPRDDLDALMPAAAPGDSAWEAYVEALEIPADAETDPASGRNAFALLLEPPSVYWDLAGREGLDPDSPHARVAPSALILEEVRVDDDRRAERASLAAWWVKQHEPMLVDLRATTQRKVLGFKPDFAFDQRTATLLRAPAWNGVGERNDNSRFAFELLLPHLGGVLRPSARALEVEAGVRAASGDGKTAVDDIAAMLQVARHARESQTLISQLVASAVDAQAWAATARMVREAPQAFDAAQLARLATVIENAGNPSLRIDWTSERLMLADAAQRMFSDDGAGDGVLIPKAALAGGLAVGAPSLQPGALADALVFLAGPVVAYGTASRAETLAKFDEYTQALDAEQAKPLSHRKRDSDAIIERLRSDSWIPDFAAIVLIAPGFDRAATTVAASALERDGARIEIALARFRLAHGREARAIAELVPAFLDGIPLDPLTGLPYREMLDGGGKLCVWSVAGDAVDDDGRTTPGAASRIARDSHAVWRVLHEFRAANGRFPATEELRSACDAAGVPWPSDARYELGVGAPRFVREDESLESGTDIRIAGPARQAPS